MRLILCLALLVTTAHAVAETPEVLLGQVDEALAAGDIEIVRGINAELEAIYADIGEAGDFWRMARQTGDEEIDAAIAEMQSEAMMLAETGDFEAAISAQEGAYMLAAEMLGDHVLTAEAARDLGFYFRQAGMVEPADNFYNEAIERFSSALGEDHPMTLEVLELLAELYAAAGGVDEAIGISEMVWNLLGGTLGDAHARTVQAALNLAGYVRSAGDAEAARGLQEETCMMLMATWGEYHPQTLGCMVEQAQTASYVGDFSGAAALYGEVLAKRGTVDGQFSRDVLYVTAELADALRESGEFDKALALLGDVVNVASLIGDGDLLAYARAGQGRVLTNQSRYDAAASATESALGYAYNHWRERPLEVYNLQLELGVVYQRRGQLGDAESTYLEAFGGLSELYGDAHPSTLVAMNNLGQLYEESGLFDLAEPMLKQALSGMAAVYGEDDDQTTRTRNNLALLFESQGNFREAQPLYERSIEALAASRGDTYAETIAVRNNLAYLFMLMQDFDASAEMFARVHEQWSLTLGPQHQFTLKAQNNLGRTYRAAGDLPSAEQLVQEALLARQETLGDNHPDAIRSMIDLGAIYIDQGRNDEALVLLNQALESAEQVLGTEHPYTFDALNELVRLQSTAGNLTAAIALAETGFSRRSRFLDRMLWVTGENAREGYLRLHRGEFNTYMTLLAELGGAEAGRKALTASLQRKGLLLKVTSEIQQISQLATDPALRETGEALQAARQELASLTLSGPTPETAGRHAEALYELEQRVNELQGDVGRASARYRSSIAMIDVDRLADVMAEDAALVDYLAYEDGDETKYLAGILIKEGGAPRYDLVNFPSREDIEAGIIEYRELIQDDAADEDELLEVGQIVYEQVWQPVEEVTGDLEYVYLIPDGALNILPFNALVNFDEDYLIRTHDLHILTSARDLLPNEYRLAQGEYLIVAGPDYDSEDVVDQDAIAAAQLRRSGLQMDLRGAASGLRGLNFLPLPGAEEEGRIITERVSQEDAPSETFFGSDAQEAILADMPEPPRILHVATHGFFLEADDNLRKRLLRLQRGAEVFVPPPGDNPLLRAGLAFAGINNNAQFLGDIDTDNDGVLTALEVLDLNLSGTRLVVLSACETGLGEIHEGEGVYGLRRSFQEAGVAEVISSLWEVSDAGTQALMTDFYDRVLSGVPARQALRETQLELMDSLEWGYPYIWSAFMIVGSYESAGITVQ